MANTWRILVVEDEESLNWSIVNSLHRDGYFVQGVMSGAEAIRRLWSEEYDVVISDLKTSGADGFELLQWIRAYRPNVRVIMVAPFGSDVARIPSLEGGNLTYLEKPLDLNVLKDEVHRLFQQTGFSANLDSFDLLDVIQIIMMSHKSIALVVSTGAEERGVLRFHEGELIWAEYGILRGEEAFFALAAYKNGTVVQQPWNEQITPNVTQPLSRLILQALQYREKYAAQSDGASQFASIDEKLDAYYSTPTNGEHLAVRASNVTKQLEDDSPFVFGPQPTKPEPQVIAGMDESLEWWQQSGKLPDMNKSGKARAVTEEVGNALPVNDGQAFANTINANGVTITPATVHKTPASSRTDLPSWLMEQPTQAEIPAVRPSSLSGIEQGPTSTQSPGQSQPTPTGPSPVIRSSTEWRIHASKQPKLPGAKTTEQVFKRQPSKAIWTATDSSANPPPTTEPVVKQNSNESYRLGSPEWRPPQEASSSSSLNSPLQSLTSGNGSLTNVAASESMKGAVPVRPRESSAQRQTSTPDPTALDFVPTLSTHSSRRDYPALVTALQTLGYSVPGFVATAIVSMDGQPIAQVAVDELNISPICAYFSAILQGALLSLDSGSWGSYEDTVITSAAYHILLRIVDSEREIFQVLITTREANPSESLEVMANVEGAIAAALG